MTICKKHNKEYNGFLSQCPECYREKLGGAKMTLLSEAVLLGMGFRPSEATDVKKPIDLKEAAGELKTEEDAKAFLKKEKPIWW